MSREVTLNTMIRISNEEILDDQHSMDNFDKTIFAPLYSEEMWKLNEFTTLRKMMAQNKSSCWISRDGTIQDDETIHTSQKEQDTTSEGRKEEKEEERGLIETYQCLMCPRRFRNNHNKKQYPGRGSMVCHLATEHGQLLKAMRANTEMDM